MSDDNFIARWSRLKRETEREKLRAEKPGERPPEARTEPPAGVASGEPSAAPGEAHRDPAPPPFDPSTLPTIESIVADTDIRAFLQKGVPSHLTNAALRRAWASDPAVRDFIEVAENQWDFTDPASIPGFGGLKASSELQQLASEALGKPVETPQPLDLTGNREEGRPPDSQPATTVADAAPEREADDQATRGVASQHPEPHSEPAPAPTRRGHGTAIPR